MKSCINIMPPEDTTNAKFLIL